MRWAKFGLAALFAVTAHAQQIAVVNFQDVVTRNCAYSAKSIAIQHEMKPELDAFAAFQGTAAQKKAAALKIQAKIDAAYQSLFAKESAAVAAFEREWAHDKKYLLVLDSSVQDKSHRPLAVMYVDEDKETSLDVTEALLAAYNAKQGCAAQAIPQQEANPTISDSRGQRAVSKLP